MQKTETYTAVWNFLTGAGMTDAGAAGLMGNLFAESGIIPNRVEILCLQRLKEHGKNYTDQTYTVAVDSGKISREEFLHPLPNKVYGYGLAQWTSPDRKGNLYDYCMGVGKSIGDLKSQLGFLASELAISYPNVLHTLQSAMAVGEASDAVLYHFEQPSEPEKQAQQRANYGMLFYDLYHSEGAKKKMSAVEKYVQEAINIANDNSHGYSQVRRWGPDYDCSSLVITVVDNAGIPVKSKGATYTGNMLAAFLACGFKDVTEQVDLSTGRGLQYGDILLNTVHHTGIYIDGTTVEAHASETGGKDGKTGDQTGGEINVQKYRNYPWDHVLRYKGAVKTSSGTKSGTSGDKNGTTSGGLNKAPKWVGEVTAYRLNVRTWAGTEYPNIKSYPTLAKTNLVDVCDTIKAADRSVWYYIRIAGKYYGFVYAKYIKKK